MQPKRLIQIVVIGILLILVYTQITIFVVQPIGALPEGKTLVMTRLKNMNFVDSADAACERSQGGVSLLCRAAMMGVVTGRATILLRLPYSSLLYSISTNGKSYAQ
jgi:hypothetical protein